MDEQVPHPPWYRSDTLRIGTRKHAMASIGTPTIGRALSKARELDESKN